MITITREWLQQKIAEIEATRDDIPFGLDEDDSNTLAALRIALASLTAEPVGTFRKGPCGYSPSFHEEAVPPYTAPPAPVVNTIDETLIEALRLVQCMLDDYRERNYGHAQEWIRHISAKMDDYSEQHGDDAYSVISAAMLQAGNSTATPEGSTCKYCGGTGYFRWQKSAETLPCPCVGCDLPATGGR